MASNYLPVSDVKHTIMILSINDDGNDDDDDDDDYDDDNNDDDSNVFSLCI